MRRVLLLLPLLTPAGCGSKAPPASTWARPQTVTVAERQRCGGLDVRVGRIRLDERGWTVTAALANRGARTIAVTLPHVRNGTGFGLSRPGNHLGAMPARRFAPPLPRRLAPGTSWRGSFSGDGRLAPGPIEVVLGVFQAYTRTGSWYGFLCVTDRALRVR